MDESPQTTTVHEHQRALPPPRKNKGGRPKFVPTPEELNAVELAAGWGCTEQQIATCLRFTPMTPDGIDIVTFRKHFGTVFRRGKAKGVMKATQTLYNKMIAGDNGCLFFYLKTQGGSEWREAQGPASEQGQFGVMVVPGQIDPEAWEKTVAEQQQKLMDMRKTVSTQAPQRETERTE